MTLASSAPSGRRPVATGFTAKKLRESGPKLIARDDAVDPLPALKEKLAGKQLPVVAVYIAEEHHGQTARRPIDPAIETEIKLLLKQCGFTIKDIPQNDLADWANSDKERLDGWPRSLNGVDLVVTGKGFSEYSARIGNLVSCAARAEINVISHKDGKIVFVDRITTRDVDLAENIAGKKALEKAGRAVGIHLLADLAKTLPDAKK